MKYFPTIGLEVHAELNTNSKMFCGCENAPHKSEANTNVCPVCLAHPGSLPVPNKEAIEMVLRFGQAIGSTKADYSEFDRKNYFYPDIPKAYQISQYAFPFLTGGELHGVELTRVHLEEDTARSSHEHTQGSLVDFNRAGVPLMELVTEPVMHDAKTAGDFARELQLVLRTLGISEANMERGEMRVEANVSVSTDETQMSTTYVEVKNINSFKAVEGAIEYEIARQIKLIEKDEALLQETRGWDENKGVTFSQRSKETAKDYRYFPDPDIPKVKISQIAEFSTEILSEKMPVLPSEKREKYTDYGLSEQIIGTIISDKKLDKVFTETLAVLGEGSSKTITLLANYVAVDLNALLLAEDNNVNELQSDSLAELVQLLSDKKIGSRGAKDLLPKLFGYTGSVMRLAEELGVVQNSDPNALADLIQQVIAGNPDQVAEYKTGKEPVLKYLVGQGMKLSKGSADPAVLENLIKTEITD